MKTCLLLILIILSQQTFAEVFVSSIQSFTETTGLDSSGTPLAGSDWVTSYATPLTNECDDFNNPSGYYYSSRTDMRDSAFIRTVVTSNVQDFIGLNQTCANDANTVLDPLRKTIWSDLGTTRDPSFGNSVVTCGATISCKNVTINKIYETKYLDTYNPTVGVNGNKASDFNFMIYDYGSLNINVTNGSNKLSGKADLTVPTATTKYCYTKHDGSTDGFSSTFGNSPVIDLKIINWKTISQGYSQPDPILNGDTSGKVKIIKGLDDTQRNFLYIDNIFSGF